LIGLPGVGKSGLARKTLQFIDERRLLSGGFIFINLRSMKDTEVFIRTFTELLVTGYPADFGAVANSALKKKEALSDSHQVLDYILTKISQFQKETLMVFDNSEDLIAYDKNSFKQLVSTFLTKIPKLKILLTSNVRLQSVKDFTEETILLYELSALQSMQLFSKLTRPIPMKESNELMKIKPDVTKYPHERGVEPKKAHDHHLFRLMCGNPATITMLAPMLTDTEHPMTLASLYQAMTADGGNSSEDGLTQAIQLSVHLSIRQLQNNDEECMSMLYLLSLLPGGILPKDLDKVWKIL
jgi:hypothetical protein